MTVFIFEEEINVSKRFSRYVSNCFDFLVDWCSDRTAIRINFFWFSVALNFSKNFVSKFSQVPRFIFINVIAPSSNCCLKTVNRLQRLEFFSDWRFSQYFCFCFEKFFSSIWFLKKKRSWLKFETTSVAFAYIDFKTIKKAVYMKLPIECFCKDSNVNFNLDVFLFSNSCCFKVGEPQLAKWTKSIFFTIFFKKIKILGKLKK